MTGRRGFELEFQGLEKLRVSSIYDDTKSDVIQVIIWRVVRHFLPHRRIDYEGLSMLD